MTIPMKEGRFFNIKIKEESMKQLDDFCKKTGLSKTSAVENALDYYKIAEENPCRRQVAGG